MFAVDIVPAPNVLVKLTATNPTGPWSEPTSCAMAISGRDVSHLAVSRWGNELHAIVADAAVGGSGANGEPYFGVSRDGGTTTSAPSWSPTWPTREVPSASGRRNRCNAR